MRHLHFIVVLSLIGPAAAVRAEDVPGPFGALAGGWGRYGLLTTKDGKDFLVPAMVPTRDGNDYVSPGLQIIAKQGTIGKGNMWNLVIGGTPSIVYWNPAPNMYDLVVPEGAKEGVLAIVVVEKGAKRQIRFEYTIEKDTLTIICKEKVPAGYWLGDYDISGRWMRPSKSVFGYIK